MKRQNGTFRNLLGRRGLLTAIALSITVLVMIKSMMDKAMSNSGPHQFTFIQRIAPPTQIHQRLSGEKCVDTLPICPIASGNAYVSDADGNKVLNEVALFFCPCLSISLRGRAVVPREVGLNVWETVVKSLDPGQEQVLINLIMDSKMYTSRATVIEKLVPKRFLNIWSTRKDEGVPLVTREMNDFSYFERGVFNDNELAIDIGSNTGIITMLLAFKYPKLLVLGIEAVAFTWMYQQVNLWCNLPLEILQSGRIRSVLAALSDTDGEILKFQFRDDSLTSSRNWNPSSEVGRTLCIVNVRTRTFHSLLDESFGNAKPPICWVKVDCEGCEYAFVPQLKIGEFSAIKSWAGELHYGDMMKYSPDKSLVPPLMTVRFVHDRLCKHMNCPAQDVDV